MFSKLPSKHIVDNCFPSKCWGFLTCRLFFSSLSISDEHLELCFQVLTVVTYSFILFLLLPFIMQLGSSIEIPEVFKRLNREGINYVELIKSEFNHHHPPHTHMYVLILFILN
ncbi:hypothetical protein ACQKWADRAFT_289820 [Trichoderma austrokoningii]